MQTTTEPKDDIDFITDDINRTLKASHTRNTQTGKRIKVRSSVEVAKDDYKRAKKLHKANIKKLKQNIKSHRLMIKQARNTYRLIKLSK